MALYLTEDDVRALVDMKTTIDVTEEAFRHLADGTAQNVPRVRATAPGIILHNMSASAEYLGLVGFKAYTTTKQGARFHVAVYDAAGSRSRPPDGTSNRLEPPDTRSRRAGGTYNGELLALIEADYLGQLRTGAASGVATECMARSDAKTVGLFGAGKQARTQLQAVCAVRQIERVDVYSPTPDRRTAFAEEMSELCNTEVVPVRAPDDAAAEKDILITATTSKIPLFDGRAVGPGTHLNVMGSNFLAKAEIDVETVRRSDVIVCDSIAQCRLEAGDFAEALEASITDWLLMHDLCDVVAGTETGRSQPEDITLFKSVGLAIEDVALAAEILNRAQAEGRGQPLPF